MLDPIDHGYLGKIKGADAIKAGDVHRRGVGRRTALVVGVNAAKRAEEMLGRAGMETVAGEDIGTLKHPDAPFWHQHDNRAPHPAIGAVAPPDRGEAIGERHFEAHSTAMALALPDLR